MTIVSLNMQILMERKLIFLVLTQGVYIVMLLLGLFLLPWIFNVLLLAAVNYNDSLLSAVSSIPHSCMCLWVAGMDSWMLKILHYI